MPDETPETDDHDGSTGMVDPPESEHQVRPAPLLLITGSLLAFGLILVLWGAYAARNGEGSMPGLVFGVATVGLGVLFAIATAHACYRAGHHRNVLASVAMMLSSLAGTVAAFIW